MSSSPEAVIDRLVEAYNAGDTRAFGALFHEDAVTVGHPDRALQSGKPEIVDHYARLFEKASEGRNEVLHRVVIGDRVVEHERITSAVNAEPYEIVSIYTVRDGLIARVDFVTQGRAGE